MLCVKLVHDDEERGEEERVGMFMRLASLHSIVTNNRRVIYRWSVYIYHMTTTPDNSIPVENVHCLIHFLL